MTLKSTGGYSISGTTDSGTTIVTDDDAVTFGTSTITADVTVGEKPFAIDTDSDGNGTNGNITFYGDIIGADTGDASTNTAADVTLDAAAATVTLEGIGANGGTEVNEINDISITGGTIKLSGVYNSTGLGTQGGSAAGDDDGAISFTGAVQFVGDTTIDSDS